MIILTQLIPQFNKYLYSYWDYRYELTVESGILMKNSKVLILESLKHKYIDQVHSKHLGINNTLKKARQFIFWKGCTDDIGRRNSNFIKPRAVIENSVPVVPEVPL